MKVPASRPSDFLAEMFKDDQQMKRVRARIVEEQKRVKGVDERRRNKESVKYGKAVGVKRSQEKQKVKKKTLDDIEDWKKTHGKGKSDKSKNAEEGSKNLESVLQGVADGAKKKGKGKAGKGKGKGKGGVKKKGKGKGKR